MSADNGALAQVSRLLTLVPYLSKRGEVPVEQAAADLGTTPARLRADLRVLFMCGLPGGMPDDLVDVDIDGFEQEGMIRVSNADYLSRPLQLSLTEGTALIVALRTLRAESASTTQPLIDRVLTKLETAVAGHESPVEVAPKQTAEELDELQAKVRSVIGAGKQLRITYYVPSRDEESTRDIDPHQLYSSGDMTYVDAWCHSAQAPRVFRLDRIHEVEVLDSAVGAPSSESGDVPWEFGADTPRAVVRLSPAARWVAEYYPVDSVLEGPDGSMEVTLPVADPRWLIRLALRVAPNLEIVAPTQWRELLSEEACQALRVITRSGA